MSVGLDERPICNNDGIRSEIDVLLEVLSFFRDSVMFIVLQIAAEEGLVEQNSMCIAHWMAAVRGEIKQAISVDTKRVFDQPLEEVPSGSVPIESHRILG